MFRRSFFHFFQQQSDLTPGFLKRIHLPLNKAIFGLTSSAANYSGNDDQKQQLITYICQELNIGSDSLQKWRSTVEKYNTDRPEENKPDSTQDDVLRLIQDCRRDLNITISPAVSVSRSTKNGFGLIARKNNVPAGMYLISVPVSSVMQAVEDYDTNAAKNQNNNNNNNNNINDHINQENSNIDARKQKDTADDEDDMFDQFFQGIESLSVPLFQSLTNPDDKFHKWVKFLYNANRYDEHDENQIFRGVKNLPYFVPLKLQPPPMSRLGMNLVVEYESRIHELLMKDKNETTARKSIAPPKVHSALRGVPEHYLRWAASTVLSRRIAGNILVPIVDFANHSSSRCNSFYTMPQPQQNSNMNSATNQTNSHSDDADITRITGLDFIDNLFSGVSVGMIFEPHLHLFSIAPIKKGEEITMSYSDNNPHEVIYADASEAGEGTDDDDELNLEVNDEKKRISDEKHMKGNTKYRKNNQSLVERQEKGDSDVWSAAAEEVVRAEQNKVLVDCGADNWRLLYGFEPEFKSDTNLQALMTISKFVVRNRIARRDELFPKLKRE